MKIFFICHEYHFKTRSPSFLVSILKGLNHDVVLKNRLDYHEWKNDSGVDLYVLWQSDDLLFELDKLNIPKICIPMLDEALSRKSKFYSQFKQVTYVSFSKHLHMFLTLSGCNSNYIQYWPTLKKKRYKKTKSIFFWERLPECLNINNVLDMTKDSGLLVNLRRHIDPHSSAILIRQNTTNRVKLIGSAWTSKKTYLNHVSESLVFISPRQWEGIGLSFLEAMALGSCVIAFDNPTMNEYIVDGFNGILIKNKNHKVDLSRAVRLGRQALETSTNEAKKFERIAPPFFAQVIKNTLHLSIEKKLRFLPSSLTLRSFIFIKYYLFKFLPKFNYKI